MASSGTQQGGSSGVRWYAYLVKKDRPESRRGKALLEDYGGEVLTQRRVIAIETSGTGRNYAVFKDHFDLQKYIASVHPDQRCMHEVCISHVPQKPRFDIDLSLKDLGDELDSYLRLHPEHGEGRPPLQEIGQLIIDLLLDNLIGILKRDGFELDLETQVILCSSHKVDKQSFHLIIDKLVHSDSKEAAAFYEEVMKFDPEPGRQALLRRYCDGTIYSGNHLLRMIGNHKLGENRLKIFNTSFVYRDKLYHHRMETEPKNDLHRDILYLGKSLICVATDCRYLPIYHVEKSYRAFAEDITDEICQEALTMLGTYYKRSLDDLPFAIDDVENGFIKLTRLESTFCTVCKRVHDTVGPFIFMRGSSLVMGCRQTKGKHVNLGQLKGVHGNALDAARRYRLENEGKRTVFGIDIDWSQPTFADMSDGSKTLVRKMETLDPSPTSSPPEPEPGESPFPKPSPSPRPSPFPKPSPFPACSSRDIYPADIVPKSSGIYPAAGPIKSSTDPVSGPIGSIRDIPYDPLKQSAIIRSSPSRATSSIGHQINVHGLSKSKIDRFWKDDPIKGQKQCI